MKKTLLIAAVSTALCATAMAQSQKRAASAPAPAAVPMTTIYKLVDDSGRITYSNLPLKGATVVELEPLTVIPGSARTAPSPQAPTQANININTPEGSNSLPVSAAMVTTAATSTAMSPTAVPAVALVTPSALPNVDAPTQKKRDDMRRKILEDEMKAEEKQLADAVIALTAQEADRTAINLMKVAAEKATVTAYAEARRSYEMREEKLRTLQETVAGHEKNVSALKKELAALK